MFMSKIIKVTAFSLLSLLFTQAQAAAPAVNQALNSPALNNPGAVTSNAASPLNPSVPNLFLTPNIRVLNKIDLSNLSNVNKTINLGQATLNLANFSRINASFSKNLDLLKSRPDLVAVNQVQDELLELDQGVLLNRKLVYTPKPGACSHKNKRKIKNAALFCGNRSNFKKSIKAISNAKSPRYIKDPQLRLIAKKDLQDTQSEMLEMAKTARRSLTAPAVIQKLGQDEVERLKQLSDEDLAAEMIESSETTLEEAIYIPKINNLNLFKSIPLLNTTNQLNPATLVAVQKYAATLSRQQRAHHANLGKNTFLTGFTFGKEYEWRKRFSKSINTCFVGCKKTYYVEPYAKLSLGLGLRFPIKTELEFDYDGRGNRAKVIPKFEAFDGQEKDYLDAGLQRAKLFGGKELVAEYSYDTGVNYKVPTKRGNKSIKDGYDFTKHLPAPFRGGNFRPPSPGKPNNLFNKTFNEIDLLGGNFNYAIASAKLHPAVKLDLSSDSLTFKIKDLNSSRPASRISSGRPYTVAINEQQGQSSFKLSDPEYNLSFKVEPGIAYNLYVDLVVWDHRWLDTIWIPQLALRLPPNGIDFSCHAGTTCNRTFVVENLDTGSPSAAGYAKKSSQPKQAKQTKQSKAAPKPPQKTAKPSQPIHQANKLREFLTCEDRDQDGRFGVVRYTLDQYSSPAAVIRPNLGNYYTCRSRLKTDQGCKGNYTCSCEDWDGDGRFGIVRYQGKVAESKIIRANIATYYECDASINGKR